MEKKKFNWLIAGIVLFFLFMLILIFPPSQSHGAETWQEKEILPEMGEGKHFSISLNKGHCGISFYSGGSVRISASFSGERNYCIQDITISPAGIVKKELICEDFLYKKMGERTCFDIYEEKCREHIDKLDSPELKEILKKLD